MKRFLIPFILIVFSVVGCAGPNKTGWTKRNFRQDEFEKDRKECMETLNENSYSQTSGLLADCLAWKGYEYTGPGKVISQDEFEKIRRDCIQALKDDPEQKMMLEECLAKKRFEPELQPPFDKEKSKTKLPGKKYGDKIPLKVGYYITANFEKYQVNKYRFFHGWYSLYLGMASAGQFKLGLQQVFPRVESIWEEYPYTKNRTKELDIVIEPQIVKFYFRAPFSNWQTWRSRITYEITLYDSKWNVLSKRFVEGIGDTKGHLGPWTRYAGIAISKAIEEGTKNAMDTIVTSKEIKTLLKR